MRLTLSLLVLFSFSTFAGEKEFPVNADYPYGYKSDKLTDADVTKEYETWLANYYIECDGDTMARIDDHGLTVSEGIGYGMLIFAYMDKQTEFDKLWKFYQSKTNQLGFMNWQIDACGEPTSNGYNGAADADLDVAMALLVASHQWPSNTEYAQDFKDLADLIRRNLFDVYDGMYAEGRDIIYLHKGDAGQNLRCINLSYYGPGYYRAFAKFYQDQNDTDASTFWNKAADDAYFTLMNNANKNTGLVYAWTTGYGGEAAKTCKYDATGGGGPTDYQFDACRTPWRISIDYLWWGDPKAKIFLSRLVNWVKTPKDDQGGWYGAGGITSVGSLYENNGKVKDRDRATPFIGAFALAGMSSSQKDADDFLGVFAPIMGDNYFNSSIALLYKLLASGNFWNPYNNESCSAPSLGENVSLCSQASATITPTNIDNAQDSWTWMVDTLKLDHSGESLTIDSSAFVSIIKENGNCKTYNTVFISDEIINPAIPAQEKLCSPTQTTLTLDGISDDIYNIYWTYDNKVIPGAYSDTLVVTQSGSYSAYISTNKCDAKKSSILISSNLTYVANSMTAIEPGASVTLEASRTAVNPVWYEDAEGTILKHTGAELTVTPTETTTYYLQKDDNDCGLTPAVVFVTTDCLDMDNDGTVDCLDLCPTDDNKIDPEDCGCNNAEDCHDCDGRPYGEAFIDSCNTCAGGKTKITPITDPSKCNVDVDEINEENAFISIAPTVSSATFTLVAKKEVAIAIYSCSNKLVETFTVDANESVSFGENYTQGAFLVVVKNQNTYQNYKVVKQ